MIWIGTSGWVYPHWLERFYPSGLSTSDQLRFYAAEFPTVEINRSYYRWPSRDNFAAWAAQSAMHPGFRFAVKASRYITHMKKLRDVDEAIERQSAALAGLHGHLGPVLYQLPPRWRANPERLAAFLAALPRDQQAAFEFRDSSWFQPAILELLEQADCVLAIGVGGSHPTPADAPAIGPFRYLRFHGGRYGIGLTDEELIPWAERLVEAARQGLTAYVYFNNDPEGHAIFDARRLRALVGTAAVG